MNDRREEIKEKFLALPIEKQEKILDLLLGKDGKRRFVLLKDTFADSEGDILTAEEETDNAIYYTDGFDRWSYLNKSEEGDIWVWLDDEDEK